MPRHADYIIAINYRKLSLTLMIPKVLIFQLHHSTTSGMDTIPIFSYTEFVPSRVDFTELGCLLNVSHWESYQNFHNLGLLIYKLGNTSLAIVAAL